MGDEQQGVEIATDRAVIAAEVIDVV